MEDGLQVDSRRSKKRVLIISERGFVKHVKYAGLTTMDVSIETDLSIECPKCNHTISNREVAADWPGLHGGVKFNPTDLQLLTHLAAKFGVGKLKSHVLLDDFITTVGGVDGICYTHPKNIPGATYDGNSCYVFYRICNAHARGTRKHRQIKSKTESSDGMVRWHMTGRPKAVVEGGVHNGYKKIFVLHSNSKVRVKAIKHNWVLHQYHLGESKDEVDGQLVVGKIFYQQSGPTVNGSGQNGPVDNSGERSLCLLRSLGGENDVHDLCDNDPKHTVSGCDETAGDDAASNPTEEVHGNIAVGDNSYNTVANGHVTIHIPTLSSDSDKTTGDAVGSDGDEAVGNCDGALDSDSVDGHMFGDSFPFWNDVADDHPDAVRFETALAPFFPVASCYR